MSPATSTQVRRRSDARKAALARLHELNEERRRRDEQELDLAVTFAVLSDECAAARAAVQAGELALGRVVDTLIGELRIRYPRVAQLLQTPEDELKRLRQLATDHATQKTPDTRASPPRPAGRGARARSASAAPSTPQPATPPGVDPAGNSDVGADPDRSQ